jgi:uncharacterized protein
LNLAKADDKLCDVECGGAWVMPISKELLEILVCPVCKASLQPTADGQGLKCGQCRRVYPIKDDIPIMLVDEARIDPE